MKENTKKFIITVIGEIVGLIVTFALFALLFLLCFACSGYHWE